MAIANFNETHVMRSSLPFLTSGGKTQDAVTLSARTEDSRRGEAKNLSWFDELDSQRRPASQLRYAK